MQIPVKKRARRKCSLWLFSILTLSLLVGARSGIIQAQGFASGSKFFYKNATPGFKIDFHDPVFQVIDQVIFEQLNSADGLSHDGVLSMLQDQYGYLWIGTRAGLNRYDGYTFTIFNSAGDTRSRLSNDTITALAEGKDGSVWIGTGNGGLNRFDYETGELTSFRNHDDDPQSLTSDYVLALAVDDNGMLWIGTAGGGIDRLDPNTLTFTHFRNDPTIDHGLSSNHIQTLLVDRQGQLWAGTIGGGLCRINTQEKTADFLCYRHSPADPGSLSNNEIYSLFEDASGNIWIGAVDGSLNRFNPESDGFAHYQVYTAERFAPLQPAVRALGSAPRGGIWVGLAQEGLLYFNPRTGELNRFENQVRGTRSISNDQIRVILQDQQGVLWIGTDGGGLNKTVLRKEGFTHTRQDPSDPDSLSDNEVFAIYEDLRGEIWVGTFGGGLNRFAADGTRLAVYMHDPDDPNSLGSNIIYSIQEDGDGNLWIGTLGGGVNRFNRRTGRFIRYQHDPQNSNSLSDYTAGVIYAGYPGEVWVGTYGRGLNRLDLNDEIITRYRSENTRPNNLADDTIRALSGDHYGAVWIGTDNGLSRLDRLNGEIINFLHNPATPNSLSNNRVLALYAAPDDTLWIGTNGGGLNRLTLKPGDYQVAVVDGLSTQVIYGIVPDLQGNLWLSTNQGIVRYNPFTKEMRVYDSGDGLPGNSLNMNAYHAGPFGTLYFGGMWGLVAFNPIDLRDDPFLPPVVLTDLTYQGEPLLPNRNLAIPQLFTLYWPQNDFEFEMAALSFLQPADNLYAYRLEGYDAEWIMAGSRRYGRYTNLAPGNYLLHLRGSNQDGVWNEQTAALSVEVVPVLWQRTWFQGFLAILVATGVWGLYHLRIHNIQTANRLLEEQVHQRTAELEMRRQVAEGLQQIILLLNSEKSLAEGLSLIVTRAQSLQGADQAYIYERLPEGGEQILVAAQPAGVQQSFDLKLINKIAGNLVSEKPYIISNGTKTVIPDETDIDMNYRTVLGIPIRAEGKQFGGFILLFKSVRTFSEEECELAMLFADQAALAIGNARLRERAQQSAVASERNRLARDLHDAVTQTLFSASLLAEALPGLWEVDPQEAHQLLGELRQLSRGALAEMRSLLLELRPAALMESGLSDLLRQLAEAAGGRAGLKLSSNLDESIKLSPELHECFYRIAQESLNNVVKHAQAARVWVDLYVQQSLQNPNRYKIVLSVKDDGIGMCEENIPNTHLGMRIMRERAQALGAQLLILSEPGKGTEIRLLWEA